ncbi:MAG TPA: metal-sensing transcriptional repressor [Pelolinea sp.]|nr:metal-sensing transcriptional repressor [Pelolinea sp.]
MNTKNQKLHRIKIIKGHLEAIERMIENDDYCIDIVHQSLAVQKALKKLDILIMAGHIQGCVVEQAKSGDFKKITEELMAIYQYK